VLYFDNIFIEDASSIDNVLDGAAMTIKCSTSAVSKDVRLHDFYVTRATSAGDGGAIVFSFVSNVHIRSAAFSECAASHSGGALYFEGTAVQPLANITVAHTLFKNCTATTTNRHGGAIFFAHSVHAISIISCDFVGNRASRGGAVSFLPGAGVLSLVASQFRDNYAQFTGGALLLDNLGVISIVDCQFYNNESPFGKKAHKKALRAAHIEYND
jgi:hypothetical protein